MFTRVAAIIGLVLMAGPAPSLEFATLEAAIEGKTLCFWEERPSDEASAGSLGQCDTITQVVDVSPSELRLQETWITAISDYDNDGPVATFIADLPVFKHTRQVWLDVDAFNNTRRPYLKFVTQLQDSYLEAHDAYCATGPDLLSAETTQIYVSSTTTAAHDHDVALPPALNRRVIEAVRLIALDADFQNGVRDRGGGDLVEILNAILDSGLCGRYRGQSFGGDGVDRWEALSRDGSRLPILDARVRIADSHEDMQLFP